MKPSESGYEFWAWSLDCPAGVLDSAVSIYEFFELFCMGGEI